MDIQSIFYTVATIFMVLGIVILITIIYFLWRLQKSMVEFKQKAEEKISSLVNDNRKGIISLIGVGLSSFVMSRIREKFRRN